MFDKIRYYYEIGLYKPAHIEKLLYVGALTQDEYETIMKEEE